MTDPSAITFRCGTDPRHEHRRKEWADACTAEHADVRERDLGRNLLALATGCEARGLAWTVQRSHATLPGRDGEFYIVTLFGIGDGPERGRTIPFTSASLAAVVEAAAQFVGGAT